jgi:hypothetical protein
MPARPPAAPFAGTGATTATTAAPPPMAATLQRSAPPAAAVAAGPPAAAPRKSGAMLGIAAAVVVLAVVGVGAYSLLSPAPRPPAPAVVATPPTPAPAPAGTAAVTPPPPVPAPAPAPATTPAAAAAPATFDVGAEFERIVKAQSPSFNLRAQAGKTQLRIGRDELSFSVQSDREGFLYVLALGSDGALTQLYPNSEAGALKVKKGQLLKLPQPPIYFETTDPPGPGQVLVMVSARQRDHSAMEPRKEGLFRTFPVGADAQRLAAAFTGPLSPLAGKPICPSSGPCDDEFGAAVIKVESVR